MQLSKLLPLMAVVVTVAACGAAENSETTARVAEKAAPSFRPDLDAVAESLVPRAARIREGDLVQIIGGVRDAQLLENLATEVRKQGAFPLVVLNSERVNRRYFDEVPAKYDAQTPAWGSLLARNADVVLVVDAAETEGLFADVSPARMQAVAQAEAPLMAELTKRGVRTLEIGNGLYPTAARAARYGISQEQLARTFWGAVAADPATLRANGARLQAVLANAREIHITHPNGTDLTLAVSGPVFVNDGAVSPEDERAGGARSFKYLPAGEVYSRVVPGSARGRLVADRYHYQGKEISGLTLEISNGRVTSMNAQSGIEPLKAQYDAAGNGRDVVSTIDFGINPAISAGRDARILTWVPAGMVTVSTGNDVWAGGNNNSTFGLSPFQAGSTVTINGKTVIENGALKLN
jgi:aminopeptidase